MSEQFKVGEVVTYVCDLANTPDVEIRSYDGQDALVIEPFGLHQTWEPGGIASNTFGYVVRFADGTPAVAEPHELRKKRPPESDESAHRQAMLDCIERAKMGAEVPA